MNFDLICGIFFHFISDMCINLHCGLCIVVSNSFHNCMFYRINNELQDGGRLISRAFTEADAEGILRKQSNGRYRFGYFELTTEE